VIEKSQSDCGRKGCFLVNAALEVAPHDKDLARAVHGYFDEIKGFLRRHMELAQAKGEIGSAIDAELYATHLLSLLMGLRVLARCCPEPSLLEAAVSPALERLRSPALMQKEDL
jgi:TetR/AcrR family transcriptional regulator, transcriptional repressor for nem operon